MSLYPSSNPIVPAEIIRQLRSMADASYQAGAMDAAYLLATVVMRLIQATSKPSFYADTPFGVCPFCGEYEEILKVDAKTYAVCHEHRIYWYIGRSYLPVPTTDEQVVYRLNLLRTYTQVSSQQAFPQAVCPCCGKFRRHAPWCLSL